jgi:hypothetical protein
MWAHQYLQQYNQIAAKNMTPHFWDTDGPYSNVFGLEPNYVSPVRFAKTGKLNHTLRAIISHVVLSIILKAGPNTSHTCSLPSITRQDL